MGSRSLNKECLQQRPIIAKPQEVIFPCLPPEDMTSLLPDSPTWIISEFTNIFPEDAEIQF
jgi:hypothetical protein